ncbi:unnamed protein product [Protopolystoma xenopodis]|uniref:Uncharacterized protein n=1 Tax=Protopolystoma xenopodis TaxID=117903 RepID=A0A3S5A5V7_9PLAT|nr:unnamed protein product [Protopolystoma xenopodis]
MPAKRLGMLEIANKMAEDKGIVTFHKGSLTFEPNGLVDKQVNVFQPNVTNQMVPASLTSLEKIGHSTLSMSSSGGDWEASQEHLVQLERRIHVWYAQLDEMCQMVSSPDEQRFYTQPIMSKVNGS